MELTDYELVKECLDGKQYAFAELVSRYKRLIYNIVYKYIRDTEEVNDISQEVFIRIYKSLDRYNPQYRFSSWASKIAVNLCLDVLRKKKVNSIPMEEIEAVSKEFDTPEAKYLEKERGLQLRKAIGQLPEKYKAVILMYHQAGASYKEMAERLNQPMSIIKNRLFRARLILRDSLAEMRC